MHKLTYLYKYNSCLLEQDFFVKKYNRANSTY